MACVSILSLLLVNRLHAQTGAGCYLKTCPIAGQVRIDAKFDPRTGAFVSGCNCACAPEISDPASPLFCAEPRTVNWDPLTLTGDCLCACPSGIWDKKASDCVAPTTWDSSMCECVCPSWAPTAAECVLPQTYNPETCSCGCEMNGRHHMIGAPCTTVNGMAIERTFVTADCSCDTTLVQCPGNQVPDTMGNCACPEVHSSGLYLPTCQPPSVKDPISCDCVTTTTTLPPAGPMDVSCDNAGDCGCPYGTAGQCTITCSVGTDACKDGTIKCNNDGYPCIVNCLSGSACAGSAHITGPRGASLSVNCLGGQSCEGSVQIDGSVSTDVSVVCDGSQACKGSMAVAYGLGSNSLQCNGSPDACVGMSAGSFVLPSNAHTTIGVAFQCSGQCPPDAPASFSNIIGGFPTTPLYPTIPPIPQIPNIPGYTPPTIPVAPVPPMIPGYPSPAATVTPIAPTIPVFTAPPIPIPGQPYPYNPVVVPTVPSLPTPAPTSPVAPGAPGGSGGTLIFGSGDPIPVGQPDEVVMCEGTAVTCSCSGTRPCTIKCEDKDSCKESTLNCPANFDCTVVCMGDGSCKSSTINGPNAKDFTLNAAGISSASDAAISAKDALHTAYTCSGKDACKGATTLNCGTGNCEIACPGESACDSAKLNVNAAQGFFCSGADHCPPNFTAPPVPMPTSAPTIWSPPCAGVTCTCNNALQCFEQPNEYANCQCECPLAVLTMEYSSSNLNGICGADSAQVYVRGGCACDCPYGTNTNCAAPTVFNQNTCSCDCPSTACSGRATLNPDTCACECPLWGTPSAADCAATGKVLRDCECQCPAECAGAGQVQSATTCACSCPAGTPLASECASGMVDEQTCECIEPLPSSFCCHPTIDGFVPWRGRCWGLNTEESCHAEPNGRCIWKGPEANGLPNPHVDCLPNPPVNNILPGQACAFRNEACTSGAECCAEVCRVNGQCR
eukprot:CAMPEP_0202685300 /NCGR_PEP_ID=MMETSP1385-20130828/1052_1 /ASSEMBLY_ACC=CAM_ASM_000861 /TAXON_ID=933848 /ORGANISM="Elphidium margaritaceum" /LENGTH=954 /DNA_ID=CAMNT_0049339615 /DNA_START=49 /DNA_END=2913 /DNA_ORIENTATION=+